MQKNNIVWELIKKFMKGVVMTLLMLNLTSCNEDGQIKTLLKYDFAAFKGTEFFIRSGDGSGGKIVFVFIDSCMDAGPYVISISRDTNVKISQHLMRKKNIYKSDSLESLSRKFLMYSFTYLHVDQEQNVFISYRQDQKLEFIKIEKGKEVLLGKRKAKRIQDNWYKIEE